MQLADKRILITGGAGFIGSHLVDALAECRLRVLDDFSTGREENLRHHRRRANVEVIRGDLRDRRVLKDALAGVDVVFHLACRGVRHSIGNPVENHEVNATGTISSPSVPISSFFVASGGAGLAAGATSAALAAQYPLTLDAAGSNPRGLLIAATTRTGTGTARAAIDWTEIR